MAKNAILVLKIYIGFDGRDTPMVTILRYSSPSFSIASYF